jgi:hypothetical protein
MYIVLTVMTVTTGVLIDDELTVKPGTPLSMEINLVLIL